jgi:hypothetical protein
MLVAAFIATAAADVGATPPPPPLIRPSAAQAGGRAPPPAITPPPPPRRRHSPSYIPMEGAREPVALVKSAVRAEAQRLYGRDCGRVTLPDRAFVPIELTGARNPEYAVLFGRAQCQRWGGSSQRWSGTGGPVVQFWFASDGPARLLLERPMMAFTPTSPGLRSLQHGTACPGGAGPNPCLVTYRWNGKDRALEVASRLFIDGRRTRNVPTMRYEYEEISR